MTADYLRRYEAVSLRLRIWAGKSQRSVSRGGQFMVETADRNGFEI
jgi:hypothetical protein